VLRRKERDRLKMQRFRKKKAGDMAYILKERERARRR